MKTPPTGRIDDTIEGLEKLYAVAHGIIAAHVNHVRHRSPGVPAQVVEQCEINGPAGYALNYIAALKLIRRDITGVA
jgi:hypothetical protein